MNLDELEDSLPNGLHDAKLLRLDVNYEAATASLELEVLIGVPGESEGGAYETYRRGRIDLEGLAFIAIDSPASLTRGGPVRISAGPGVAPTSQLEPPSDLPQKCFIHWIFVSDWNGFIHVAAEAASHRWLDE